MLRIFQRVCEAVAFAHANGVIHRDIKPENVMVGPFGEVLLMDWGVAKMLHDTGINTRKPMGNTGGSINSSGEADALPESPQDAPPSEKPMTTEHGTILGTPAYMAPEQAFGWTERVDERADVYALGATLYFLLTSSPPPINDRQEDHQKDKAMATRVPPDLKKEIPRALEAICFKALSVDPAGRYGSAKEMAVEMDRFLNEQAVSAYKESFIERLNRFFMRHRFIILLVLTYIIMRLIVLLVARR